jgi:glutathione S-transferase
MKLYTYDPAPNPARLKMFLDYKDIHIETQQIDMAKLEQHSEAYLLVVPEATVPVLVLEDGTRVTEVIAIAHYLESLFPERPLLGVTPLEKAMVLNWNHRLFQLVFMAAAEAFRNSHPQFKDRALPGVKPVAQIAALAERGQDRLRYGFEVLNDELAGRDWIAGSSFSFADIDLLALWVFAGWGARMQPDEGLTHLHAWHNRAKAALAVPA